ncbi:hypothetical protein ACQ86G_21440 [Roseateles chitinivorans]|uniref:hypothetical protein n=1 Tax=Roseateles chitinivorans TaxID=2917965 RepID=UPI003D66E5F9
MRYTVKTVAQTPVQVEAVAGQVVINGLALLPHEADMIGQALSRCADRAESIAAEAAAALEPQAA